MLSSRPISFNGDVDIPQSILNAKTPGRKALKGRIALQENAVHTGSKTVLSKKNILQTPFRPGTAHGKKPLVSISVTRPLMDKTPFPNRVAAAAFGGAGPAGKTPGTKLSKLALLVSEPQQQQESLSPDVAPLLRPSSARRSLRGRLSGGTFKTPLTKGNYWDVSPGDMEGIGGVAGDAKEEAEAAVAEEDDEIEYMPPTAVELPYEPPFEMPDYKAMGRALFTLAHGRGLMDDAADVYYAMDIEQQLDITQLLADAGFKKSDPRDDDGLQLPELEDDSPFPFARKPDGASGPVPQPQTQPRPPAASSKSASSIPLTRTSSTRAVSSRAQPSTAPARPATTTPPIQGRPTSTSSSSSRVPQPAVVVAPGQTRTSALRAAKAAATAAAAGASAPKTKMNSIAVAARRPVASASSSIPNTTAAGTGAGTQANLAKAKTQAQAPSAPVQTRVQAKVQARGLARPIARSVTSGAVPANANAKVNAGTGTGTGTGVSAGTGAGVGLRSRSATLAANANASASASANSLGKARVPLNGSSGVMRPGARGGKADGRANDDGKVDGDPDELATALENAHAHAVAGDGEPDFVFDI